MGQDESRVIRVKSTTDAQNLSKSITTLWTEDNKRKLIMRCIGASAINQAVKAVIIANKFFIQKGLTTRMQPSFRDIPSEEKQGKTMTAVEFKLSIEYL